MLFHKLPNMGVHSSKSKIHAKRVSILGHTVSGMGERTLALKYQRVLECAGYTTPFIHDIVEMLGENFKPWAELNYALAEADQEIFDDLREIPIHIEGDLFLILSWCFGLAALFATGIQKKAFTAARFFVHHSNERVIPKLYEPADLLITESLLANERAIDYGINPAKLLYLPNTYPKEWLNNPTDRAYALRLAEVHGKTIRPATQIIGTVCRLEYGKNVEYAIEATRRLYLQKKDVLLILKGSLPSDTPYPEYQLLLRRMLEAYKEEPWLIWDNEPTPFPQVMQEYASFDLLLHPSGAEGGGQVIVECLGLSKPVVLLACSTLRYQYSGIAHFVRTKGEIKEALLPFYVPDLDDLCQVLAKELAPPDRQKVEERFHEDALSERLALLFEPDPDKIKKSYLHDRKLYQLPST